jgi:hypothetical protein
MSFLRHGKSIDPMWDWKTPGQELGPAPALIDLDEFRLAIPRRDALQQGPPPLPQPGAACSKLGSSVEHFSSNGKLSLNWLSHPRGQAQLLLFGPERAILNGEVTFPLDYFSGGRSLSARY